MSESESWQPPTFNETSAFAFEPRAGFWMRFLAHICDGITISLVMLPFQIISNQLGSGASGSLVTLAGVIFGIYMQAQWTGKRGGTPLRVRLGVLVLDQYDGSYIGTSRAVNRVLMGYVSQAVFMIGYLSMLWNPNKQTWHDRVAKSVVVKR
jgi:uncharacterized RDD family membrane protein YckC